MEHVEYWELIEQRADGQLQAQEVERLERHLATCAECAVRLHRLQEETRQIRQALEAPEPPSRILTNVMAAIREPPPPRTKRSLQWAVYAGMAGNLITALVLVLVSLGSSASLGGMVLVALGAAIAWGALKGLAFGWSLRFLPESALVRGIFFGLGMWAINNVLLAVSAPVGQELPFSASFLLLGSLTHYLIYGLLVSLLYGEIARRLPVGAVR